VKQGRVTADVFRALGTDCAVLPSDSEGALSTLATAAARMRAVSAPYALIVRDGTFAAYKLQTKIETSYELAREGSLRLVAESIGSDAIVVATTGKTARELFEYRQVAGQSHRADFRTVGCMGHASQIALGLALARPERPVFCLDGDGAVIMHMGALAIIGSQKPKNFRHIVFNNGAHDSVGGQPTAGFDIDIPRIAAACGYRLTMSTETSAEIADALAVMAHAEGPVLLEIRVNKGARANLGRPTASPAENKRELMQYLCE
jgi:phosphonopyruvate decarboxylase